MGQERRLKLHQELVDILGSPNVYFQPPSSTHIQYPCIIYSRASGDTIFADNAPYSFRQRYDVTYIDLNPDNEIVDRLANHFPLSRYDRNFVSDNLNHDVISVYY